VGVQLLHGLGISFHELAQRPLVSFDYSVELRCGHSRSASLVSDPCNEDIIRPEAITGELLANACATDHRGGMERSEVRGRR
jgi:hypothetical protein